MRVLPFLSAPLVMAATVFGAGWWLRSQGMLYERLTYDAWGGPAAYVLYALVVGLGVLHLLFDRTVEAVRLVSRSRRAGHPFLSEGPSTSPRPSPSTAGPAPAPLPPLPPTTIHRRPARVARPQAPATGRPAPAVSPSAAPAVPAAPTTPAPSAVPTTRHPRVVRAVRRPRVVAPAVVTPLHA